MKQSNQNFPYPILAKGSLDYDENCKFSISLNSYPKEIAGFINLSIGYSLISNGLEEMISQNEASVYIQLICKETSVRRLYCFDDKKELNLSLNKKDFSGNVEINSFIISNKDSKNFLLPEHNKNFFLLPLAINQGDKLAIGESISFKLNKFDALRPIASIVSIKENKINNTDVDVDLSNDKIIIYLSKEIFEEYKKLREFPELRSYLSLNIVMPAIVEALSEIKNNDDAIDAGKRWVFTINKLLKLMNIDLYSTDLSCYSIANLIFKNGLKTSLLSLDSYFFADKED